MAARRALVPKSEAARLADLANEKRVRITVELPGGSKFTVEPYTDKPAGDAQPEWR
jgi:hypothetical protein